MLLVVLDEVVVHSGQQVLDIHSEALVVKHAAVLCVVVGLEVAVHHVVQVERVLGLLAELHNAFIDLARVCVFGAGHASHERGHDSESLWTVLLDQCGELLDSLNSGRRVAGLEQIIVTHMQQRNLSLDGVVHFQRASQVVNADTSNKLDSSELLGRVEAELLRLWLILTVIVVAIVLLSRGLIEAGIIWHKAALQIAVQRFELGEAHNIANDEEIALQV